MRQAVLRAALRAMGALACETSTLVQAEHADVCVFYSM